MSIISRVGCSGKVEVRGGKVEVVFALRRSGRRRRAAAVPAKVLQKYREGRALTYQSAAARGDLRFMSMMLLLRTRHCW